MKDFILYFYIKGKCVNKDDEYEKKEEIFCQPLNIQRTIMYDIWYLQSKDYICKCLQDITHGLYTPN